MTKNKEQKIKENNSTLSGQTVSTAGCHCRHGYKITNTYEDLHSSHCHLKKHGLFSGALEQVEGKGERTLLGGHCGITDGHDREEDMHNSAEWKNMKPKQLNKNEGAK